MPVKPRVDYDVLAPLYDAQPFRDKQPDLELQAFLRARGTADDLRVLDVGCGTGNQLVADRALAPDALLVGADPFLGMLRQAAGKGANLRLVRAKGEQLPFRSGLFDFVTAQFQFHHVADKPGMVREALRLLRPGGRFVLTNISPREQDASATYRFFPQVREDDLRFYPSKEELGALFEAAGFAGVKVHVQVTKFTRPLTALLEAVKRRTDCSQLYALDDAAYGAGVAAVEEAVRGGVKLVDDCFAIVTVRGEKTGSGGGK